MSNCNNMFMLIATISTLILSTVLLNKCFCMYLCFSLVTISKFNYVSLYNISDNVQIFKQIMRMDIPHEQNYYEGAPHSTHWFYDANVFTVGCLDCIQFWDSRYFRVIDTVPLYSSSLNHVIAAKTCINNKHVAST